MRFLDTLFGNKVFRYLYPLIYLTDFKYETIYGYINVDKNKKAKNKTVSKLNTN